MKISYNWLKEYVDINISPEKLAELLTMHSFEVENIIYQGEGLDNVVVGEILEIKKHPNADKLNLVKVDIGKNKFLDIVCGAPNVKVDQKVAVALVGAKLSNEMIIEKRKVRGIESNGMVCAEDELGIGETHEGIMVLDKNLKVGTEIKKALNLDDVIFEIDILPNRAHDCLSHFGVAREVAVITSSKFKVQSSKLRINSSKISNTLNVKIENKELCRRYAAANVKGIEIKKSPSWLKKNLQNCDIRPINNIVDITNYVMLALGQPMHAFDADKLNGKIIVRNAKKGEKIIALDENEYKLKENDLVIADEKKPIAIAGVMGGMETAVDENTKNIIFEAANFQGTNIRKTSQRLKLSSESSYRFEREIDPELAIKAIEMALDLTKNLAGGEIRNIIDLYPKPAKPKEIEFDYNRVENLLGIKIEIKKCVDILNSLGFEVKQNKNNLKMKIPTYRIDIEKVNDIIEEIGRIYGYSNIPETPAVVKMKAVTQDKIIRLEKNMKNNMEGLGWTEAYNYSFMSAKDIENIKLKAENFLELENPLSEEHRFMRTSFLPGLLRNVNLNLKYEDRFSIFEMGRIYLEDKKTLPEEKRILAGITVDRNAKETLFYKTKNQLEILFNKLCISVYYKEIGKSEAFWHKGRSAEILCDNKLIGKIGEIHPVVANAFDVKERVLYFEIYQESLIEFCSEGKIYQQINKFPSSELDLSVIFNKEIKWADIKKIILNVDNRLIKSVKPFDLYCGKRLGENKKSIAFRIFYQAEDRTLKDEEIKAIQNKVVKELEKLGGEVRK